MKRSILSFLAVTGIVFLCSAQTKHVVGEKWGGGIVFIVSSDGKHGLIAETADQGKTVWDRAKATCKTGTHSTKGKAFTDWRLPTKTELNEMYLHIFDIEGFTSGEYWCSTEDIPGYACCEDFVDGTQSVDHKGSFKDVRAVRAF